MMTRDPLTLADTFFVSSSKSGATSRQGVRPRKEVQFDGERWHRVKAGTAVNRVLPTEIAVDNIASAYHALAPLTAADNVLTTLIYGVMTEESRLAAARGDMVPRTERAFLDVRRRLHFLDIDNLRLPGVLMSDPIGRIARELVERYFPAEFADVSFVAMASGSHGTVAKAALLDVPRLRLAYWLDEAVTIAQFGRYVSEILEPFVAKKAPLADKNAKAIDPTIYQPSRMLFVAPPGAKGGPGPYARPRCELVRGDHDEFPFGNVELENSAGVDNHPDRENAVGVDWAPGVSDHELLDEIDAGHSHWPILRLMARVAARNPQPDDLERAVLGLEGQIVRRLRETSYDDEDFARRIGEEIAGGKLLASAKAFRAKLDDKQPIVVHNHPDELQTPQVPPDVQFVGIHEAVREFRARAVQWRNDQRAVIATLDDPGAYEPPAAPMQIIKAPPGAGKTRAFIECVDDRALYKELILYVAPHHDLARQTYEDLRGRLRSDEDRAQIVHWMGRHHYCDHDRFRPIADRASAAGVNVLKHVCALCPKRDECGYYTRDRKKSTGIIIATHADLMTTFRGIGAASELIPDLIVIDESAFQSILEHGKADQALERLKPYTYPYRITPRKGEAANEAEADFVQMRTAVLAALNKSGGDVETTSLGQIPDAGAALQLEHRMRAAILSAASAYVDEIAASGGDDARRGGPYADAEKSSRVVRNVLRALEVARQNGSARLKGVTVGCNKFGDEAVETWLRPALPPVLKAAPILFLDATAEPRLWETLLEAPPDTIGRYEAWDAGANYHLTQFADHTYSKRMLLRGNRSDKTSGKRNGFLAQISGVVQAKSAQHQTVGLIAQKSVLEEMTTAPQNVLCATFGSVRGINAMSDVDCLIVVGRIMPRMVDVEAMAAALTFDQASDICRHASDRPHFGVGEIKVRREGGASAYVGREAHPDPICDLILNEMRAEVAQAVGRARIPHRPAERPCEIIVLGQNDPGLPVDEFASLGAIDPIDQIEAVGVMPATTRAVKDLYPFLVGRRQEQAAIAEAVQWRAKSETWRPVEYRPRTGARRRSQLVYLTGDDGDDRLRRLIGDGFEVTRCDPYSAHNVVRLDQMVGRAVSISEGVTC